MAKKKTTKKKAATKKASRKRTQLENRLAKRKEKAQSGQTVVDAVKKMDEKTRAMIKLPRDEVFHRIFTGLLDIDITGCASVGRRVQVIGQPNYGKSMLLYIIGGAAQRTCRLCYTPIIPWIDDWSVYQKDPKEWEKRMATLDFDTKVSCLCGENDPMRVMLVDTEDCYDRYWSSLWGLQAHTVDTLSLEIDPEDVEDEYEDVDGDTDGIRHTLFLCKPESSTYFESITLPMIASGAIDVILVDSLAQIAVQEDLDGFQKIGAKARFLKRQLTLILSKQMEARTNFGTRPTFMATNHLMSGPVANPKMNPYKDSGGMAWGYTKDIDINIVSSKSNATIEDGHKVKTVMRDVKFGVKKSKINPGGRGGAYRLFLDDYQKSANISYRAGETNEPEMLLSALKDLDDPRLYRVEMRGKTKTGYFLLGRVFKRVKDMVTFLKRRDVQFQLRPLIMAGINDVSVTEKMHIRTEEYTYNPFDDYIKDQIHEREQQLGEHFFKTRVVSEQREKDRGRKT